MEKSTLNNKEKKEKGDKFKKNVTETEKSGKHVKSNNFTKVKKNGTEIDDPASCASFMEAMQSHMARSHATRTRKSNIRCSPKRKKGNFKCNYNNFAKRDEEINLIVKKRAKKLIEKEFKKLNLEYQSSSASSGSE